MSNSLVSRLVIMELKSSIVHCCIPDAKKTMVLIHNIHKQQTVPMSLLGNLGTTPAKPSETKYLSRGKNEDEHVAMQSL
jgi:hypothetical protein